MKKCPYCGKENDDNVKNCQRCSAMIPNDDDSGNDNTKDSKNEETYVPRKKLRS